MTYAIITIVTKVEDGCREIPSEWFDRITEPAYFSADIYDEPFDVDMALKSSSMTMKRKVGRDGLPRSAIVYRSRSSRRCSSRGRRVIKL